MFLFGGYGYDDTSRAPRHLDDLFSWEVAAGSWIWYGGGNAGAVTSAGGAAGGWPGPLAGTGLWSGQSNSTSLWPDTILLFGGETDDLDPATPATTSSGLWEFSIFEFASGAAGSSALSGWSRHLPFTGNTSNGLAVRVPT